MPTLKLITMQNLNNVHGGHGNKNTEFNKSEIQTLAFKSQSFLKSNLLIFQL